MLSFSREDGTFCRKRVVQTCLLNGIDESRTLKSWDGLETVCFNVNLGPDDGNVRYMAKKQDTIHNSDLICPVFMEWTIMVFRKMS